MSDTKEYVVTARVNGLEVKSSVKADNLQEATRLSLKYIPPRVGYRAITISEVMAGVSEDA